MIKIKSLLAGITGSGSGIAGWLASAHLRGLLGNLLALTSFVPIIVSVWYIRKINRHKDHTAAIREAQAQRDLCRECQSGKTPISCPIELSARPENCPLRRRRKHLKFFKKIQNMFSDETTTT